MTSLRSRGPWPVTANDLSAVSSQALKSELIRREGVRRDETRKDPYHPRKLVNEIVRTLQKNRVFYRHQAVTICGAAVWLHYVEYANAFGGRVMSLMMDIDGVEVRKEIMEAHFIDCEIGEMIRIIREYNKPGETNA